MDIAEYQTRTRDTAVFPDNRSEEYTAIALAGEVGELLNNVKKEIRDGHQRTEKIKDEIGDVLWYLAQFCDVRLMSLNQCAQENLEKLQKRKVEGGITSRPGEWDGN